MFENSLIDCSGDTLTAYSLVLPKYLDNILKKEPNYQIG